MTLPVWARGLAPDDLPGDLQIIAQECGLHVALSLAEKLGGMKLYVPQTESALLNLKKAYIRDRGREYSGEQGSNAQFIRNLIMDTRLSETTVRETLREAETVSRQATLPLT